MLWNESEIVPRLIFVWFPTSSIVPDSFGHVCYQSSKIPTDSLAIRGMFKSYEPFKWISIIPRSNFIPVSSIPKERDLSEVLLKDRSVSHLPSYCCYRLAGEIRSDTK